MLNKASSTVLPSLRLAFRPPTSSSPFLRTHAPPAFASQHPGHLSAWEGSHSLPAASTRLFYSSVAPHDDQDRSSPSSTPPGSSSTSSSRSAFKQDDLDASSTLAWVDCGDKAVLGLFGRGHLEIQKGESGYQTSYDQRSVWINDDGERAVRSDSQTAKVGEPGSFLQALSAADAFARATSRLAPLVPVLQSTALWRQHPGTTAQRSFLLRLLTIFESQYLKRDARQDEKGPYAQWLDRSTVTESRTKASACAATTRLLHGRYALFKDQREQLRAAAGKAPHKPGKRASA